jgi:arylsulfatase A-like enzyme
MNSSPLRGAIALIALLQCGAAGAQETAETLPNLVIIFTDDQGWADVGVQGAQGFETPNLDRMAQEGMRFTSFYAAQPVCSASRAALLTGCYPNRIGISGALGPRARHGIHTREVTLAEICKSRGYATGMYGKWHLGHLPKFLPTRHGFDEYVGTPYSNDMWPLHPDLVRMPDTAAKRKRGYPNLPLIEGGEIIDSEITPEDQTRFTTLFTEKAVGFIERNRKRPFFLYVAHPMPHVPLFVSKKYEGTSKQGLYGDVISEIDWSVGRILAALEKNGISDRTLVIFTSDNGPWLSYGNHGGSAGPLREGKGTTWEGGVRVAMAEEDPVRQCERRAGDDHRRAAHLRKAHRCALAAPQDRRQGYLAAHERGTGCEVTARSALLLLSPEQPGGAARRTLEADAAAPVSKPDGQARQGRQARGLQPGAVRARAL